MKIKKFLITLFTSILIIGILCGLNGKSYSATGNLELSIEMLRKSGYGYKAFEKNIWKIVSEDDKYKYDSTIYCLKAGPGFGSSDMGTAVSGISSVVYTQYFDMKRKDEIPSEYLEVLPDNESDYNAVLWILDHAYIAPKTNASSDEKNYAQAFRNDLLTSAGISLSSPISDDEIDAVQQAAIWYFTNSDSDIYHQRNISMWANRQANSDADYTSLENVFGRDMGADKEEAISYLYDYLITEAEKAGRDYDSTSGNSPISLVKNQAKIVVEDGKLISGPYMIKQENNDLCALATSVTDKEGNQISDSSILIEQDGNKVPTSTPLNRLLNQEFYISVPQSSTSSIKLEIRVQYFNTSATFWSVANPDSRRDQPVVIIDRIMDEYSDSDVKEYTEKNFDLALRKYIYSIDGVKPTVDREPQVNTDNLKQGKTTAEKVHTKDPLIVRTGSKVIYRISIYNEGNVDGYATEITDYLPEGLKLAENSQINNDNGWVSSADGKTVTTTKLKDTLISKYDGGDTLSKIELEIECEVTAVSKIDSQTLKNVAEITKQKDIDDNETDIDSIPGNLTEEEKSEYNPGESEKGWGYEDDDDYEDLILPGQSLDLALRKFIIQIADTELKTGNRYDREPNIDLTELKNGTKTTAEYRHTKESISVSIGDEVIYMIRVYNEGKLDGYASEITDYLPPELEFIENDSLNKSYGWVLQSDGRTIKTTALAKNGILDLERNTEGAMLHAFDGNTLDYKELKVKCRVKGSVIISGQEQSVRTGKNITNIAEITQYQDSEGNIVNPDIDSSSNNVILPSDEILPDYKGNTGNKEDLTDENYHYKGQEDDDDFEKIYIKPIDLSLRKFITGVGDRQITDREPQVDITPLINKTGTTAIYNHTKEPIGVKVGDIVTYTIRVYNEGDQDVYAGEIIDHLPPELEFIVDDEINIENGWQLVKDNGEIASGRTIKTTALSKGGILDINDNLTRRLNGALLRAFNGESLDYIDLQVRCRVKLTINNNPIEQVTILGEATRFNDSWANIGFPESLKPSN